MIRAQELHQPVRGIFLWQAYDSSVKTDLFSTAVVGPSGLYFIDPIPLADPVLEELAQMHIPAAVVTTNGNHHRAAADYAEQFSIPIATRQNIGPLIDADIATICIDGAGENEIAVFQNGGTLIVGDALVNLPPHGFTFLPRKYCSDAKEMRRSLNQLLDFNVERIFFAHGEPILIGAAEKLRQLLQS
jgi:hypothetical protein